MGVPLTRSGDEKELAARCAPGDGCTASLRTQRIDL